MKPQDVANALLNYRVLAQTDFNWKATRNYEAEIRAVGDHIEARCGDASLAYTDEEEPWLEGAVGVCARDGAYLGLKRIEIEGVELDGYC